MVQLAHPRLQTGCLLSAPNASSPLTISCIPALIYKACWGLQRLLLAGRGTVARLLSRNVLDVTAGMRHMCMHRSSMSVYYN